MKDGWGEDNAAAFWKHLYEDCDPKICVWCEIKQEFVKWTEEGTGE